MSVEHLFATAMVEHFCPGAGRETESSFRIECGQALTTTTPDGRFNIEGTDSLDQSLAIPLSPEARDYLASVECQGPPGTSEADVRFITRRRAIVSETLETLDEQSFAIVSTRSLRGVVASADAAAFAAFLSGSDAENAGHCSDRSLSLLFAHGSATVLLHEAIGHPAELGQFAPWPSWLRISDAPPFAVDDLGAPTFAIDLLRQTPQTWRRFHWRDAPLQRMSNLQVEVADITADRPKHYIEVVLVDEGSWDPLSGMITLAITLAYEVNGGERFRIEPFRIALAINALPNSIAAIGRGSIDYPGVICGLAGQTLRVSGSAPDILLQVRT